MQKYGSYCRCGINDYINLEKKNKISYQKVSNPMEERGKEKLWMLICFLKLQPSVLL